MVLKFQGMAEKIPQSVQSILHAWEQMYWRAKTNRVCHGAVTEEELRSGRQLLEGL